MPRGSEDAAIMFARAQLESFWLNNLTDDERAAWLGHWMTDPPSDAIGRTYTPYARTSLQQTQRPAQTIYAWSQIFATYRLKRPPTRAPISAPPVYICHTSGCYKLTDLCLFANTTSPTVENFGLIIHTTPPMELTPAPLRPPEWTNTQNPTCRLRPVKAIDNVAPGQWVDFTAEFYNKHTDDLIAYFATHDPAKSISILVRFQTVSPQGTLTPTTEAAAVTLEWK